MCSSKDQWFEAWDDYYAKQDASRERHHDQIRNLMDMDPVEQQYVEYMTRVSDAGFGYDHEAYEACWTRMLEYYHNEPVALDE